jgi:hypothetical protein
VHGEFALVPPWLAQMTDPMQAVEVHGLKLGGCPQPATTVTFPPGVRMPPG